MSYSARIARIIPSYDMDNIAQEAFDEARDRSSRIAAEADAERAELVAALKAVIQWVPSPKVIENIGLHSGRFVADLETARALLARIE